MENINELTDYIQENEVRLRGRKNDHLEVPYTTTQPLVYWKAGLQYKTVFVTMCKRKIHELR
jgi:hypothetical protein